MVSYRIKMISIEKLNMGFSDAKNKVSLFKNLNLEIKSNEFLIILGQNGSGKTTLLNLISGLEKPLGGKIFINRKIVKEPSKDVGFIFQEPYLFPWKTVRENIMVGLEINKVDIKMANKQVNKYLKFFSLNRFQNYYPKQLSSGMKQKVAIARALMINPKVLLFDEPFSSLDEKTKNNLQKEIIKIWKTTNKTILYVTHNKDEALFFGTRILYLNRGKLKLLKKGDLK